MKAALVEPIGDHGGMDTYNFGLANGLLEAGVDVRLYTSDKTASESSLSFPVFRFYRRIWGEDPRWRRALRFLAGTWRSLWHARGEGCQVCHLHFFRVGPLELFNLLVARLLGMRTVVTAHDIVPLSRRRFHRVLARIAYRFADRIIAHNQVSREHLLSSHPTVETKMQVIPHGNHFHALVEDLSQNEARRRLELPLDARLLLSFGHIKETKRLDLLLHALPTVIQTIQDVLVVVAGRPWRTDVSRYERLIRDLGIEAHCRLELGYVPNELVGAFFSSADLVVLPYDRIYQSSVLMAALSRSKPVLCSDIQGMKETLAHDETGFFFRRGDAADLAKMIVEILSDPERARTIGANGRELMEEPQYDWRVIGEMTRDCYFKAMDAMPVSSIPARLN